MPSCMARAYTLDSVMHGRVEGASRRAGRAVAIGACRRAVARDASGRDTIEIHEAEGAFERLEEWLRERGFFAPGGEELVADLYLGYGLSSTIRRHHSAHLPSRARCRSRPVPSGPTAMLPIMTMSDR